MKQKNNVKYTLIHWTKETDKHESLLFIHKSQEKWMDKKSGIIESLSLNDMTLQEKRRPGEKCTRALWPG